MNHIRIADIADLEKMTEIYNQAVLSKFETADTVEFESKDRLDWFIVISKIDIRYFYMN